MEKSKFVWIRYIYLYLVTAISIVLILISTIGLVKLALTEYVFNVQDWQEIEAIMPYECGQPKFEQLDKVAKPVVDVTYVDPNGVTMTTEERDACIVKYKEKADATHRNDFKRSFAEFLAMLIIALPLYLYHWGIIRKDSKN